MIQTLPYPIGTSVRVSKIATANNPVSEPCAWEDWVAGSADNVGSLPIDYELRGFLLQPVTVGCPMVILRTERNGVEVLGMFESTPVCAIADGVVETFNSRYLVDPEEE